MKLKYFPVNSAWAFVFGDAPCQFFGFELFFSSHEEALRARHSARIPAIRPKRLLLHLHPCLSLSGPSGVDKHGQTTK